LRFKGGWEVKGFFSRKVALILLAIALVISIGLNIYLIASQSHIKTASEQKLISQNNYNLLYPYFENLDEVEFENIQKYYRTQFIDLKKEINESIKMPPGTKYAVFIESLNSGVYIGINEKEKYSPGSLRKTPLLAAVYKKIEQGELSKKDVIQIIESDVDPSSGPLGLKGAGIEMTIAELINYTAYYSDNTAALALLRVVGVESYMEAMFNTGLSFKTFLETQNREEYPLSAKEYSNVFRSLYYASWLSRDSSQEILDLLAHTSFTQGLPKGVPPGIIVSHKIGFWSSGNQHHDCGIVYYPGSPYIICVMIVGLDEISANNVTAQISKIAYNYIDDLIREK
jgi:beta-lactamase class A